MPGKPTSGNRSDQRGKPTRTNRKINKEAALALRLLTWQSLGRPATDEEEDALLSSLVLAEQARRAAEAAGATDGLADILEVEAWVEPQASKEN